MDESRYGWSLAGTRVRKIFLVLGLLLFTSLKCEDKTSENLNLCCSAGIIFLLFDLHLDFNFAPNISDLKRRVWALQAQSTFSSYTSWLVKRSSLPSHRPIFIYVLRPLQLLQHCSYHCDRYFKGFSISDTQGNFLQCIPWWLSPFNNLDNYCKMPKANLTLSYCIVQMV